MDRHPPEGFFSADPPADFLNVPDIYAIPLGSLYSRNIENLYLAGRCHSATYTAHGSTRVMGTCLSMGQAVGMAAAVGSERSCRPRQVRESHVQEVRQRLLKEDVFLVDVAGEDPQDLACSARLTASSCESGESGPENVTNGIARPRNGKMNLWAGRHGDVGEAWLEIGWDARHTVSEVRLAFDTNLEPDFEFSIFPYVENKVTAPVAETVADYRIQARSGGEWRTVAHESGNYQRHRVHRLIPVRTDALRICFEKTNGADQARVYEVRVY
jgi:hypothetical protein